MEASFTEETSEHTWNSSPRRRLLQGSQVEERVGGSYACTLHLQLQELG